MSKSTVLYYSKYCKNCNNVLKILGRSSLKNNIHFLSIDKRLVKNNTTYLVLDDGKEILLPSVINKVPAVLLLHSGNKILFGDEILQYYRSQLDEDKKAATKSNGEPLAFSFSGEMSSIMSDKYSYLDQSSDELGVKGSGGLRQMHAFQKINALIKIDTPPEDYVKEKMGSETLKNYQEDREKAVSSVQNM
tara:strand:- start:176 stop:748 length:573 start_codon:yes stop_codon:yes gene_type:complete